MQSSGYSPRPLIVKLGLKEKSQVFIHDAPHAYRDMLGASHLDLQHAELENANLDFVHYFVMEKQELARIFPALVAALKKDGQLWISWPKGSAKVETDINENIVRELGLANGVVDVKVISVDEIWSGLKFVFRLADRN